MDHKWPLLLGDRKNGGAKNGVLGIRKYLLQLRNHYLYNPLLIHVLFETGPIHSQNHLVR